MAKTPEWRFDQEAWDMIMAAATDRRVMRKGDRHRKESNEKRQRSRDANLARRQREAVSTATAERHAAARARWLKGRDLATNNQGRLLRLMEPGGWYGARDLYEAAGMLKDQAAIALVHMREKGWLTRTRNPAHDGAQRTPGEIMARQAAGVGEEPVWLYGLLEGGIAAKEKSRQGGG
ncbi:MAG: hypothetical protein GEV06_16720 [Luteitalea sp.]|nr:hypothetical protein [Luteitalea sp.]